MADDWQPGDLALCVNDTPNPRVHDGDRVKAGRIYTVEGVRSELARNSVFGFSGGLFLLGVRSGSELGTFATQRFRKILPHTPDAEDAETIRLLQGKPVRERVS